MLDGADATGVLMSVLSLISAARDCVDAGIEELVIPFSMYPLEQEVHEDMGCDPVLDGAAATEVLMSAVDGADETGATGALSPALVLISLAGELTRVVQEVE